MSAAGISYLNSKLLRFTTRPPDIYLNDNPSFREEVTKGVTDAEIDLMRAALTLNLRYAEKELKMAHAMIEEFNWFFGSVNGK